MRTVTKDRKQQKRMFSFNQGLALLGITRHYKNHEYEYDLRLSCLQTDCYRRRQQRGGPPSTPSCPRCWRDGQTGVQWSAVACHEGVIRWSRRSRSLACWWPSEGQICIASSVTMTTNIRLPRRTESDQFIQYLFFLWEHSTISSRERTT